MLITIIACSNSQRKMVLSQEFHMYQYYLYQLKTLFVFLINRKMRLRVLQISSRNPLMLILMETSLIMRNDLVLKRKKKKILLKRKILNRKNQKMNLIMQTKRNRKKKKKLLPLVHRSQSETRKGRTRNVEERVLFQFNLYS